MICCVHDSVVGPLTLHSNGVALTGLEFADPKYALPPSRPGEDAILTAACRELDEYFAGSRREFAVPLAPHGTPFQQRVWQALTTIPYGSTRSYGQQAAAIGAPMAVRAVGLANGKNPISIIIPCHRVIGANGALTGFGGGLGRKRFLLELESSELPLRFAENPHRP